jgi:glycosyltransferase involved in cell wall biosynthesis
MFVYNNFLNDSRVEKEANTLVNAGYEVTVMVLLDDNTQPVEMRNKIRILRVRNTPWYKQGLGVLRKMLIPGGIREYGHPSEKNEKVHYGIYRESAVKKISRKIRVLFSHLSKAYVLKTIIYTFLLVGVIEILLFVKIYAWVVYQKILIYGLLCILIAVRARVSRVSGVFRFFKSRIRSYIHRKLCFLSFYANIYKLIKTKQFNVYHAHDLNTLPIAYLCAKRNKSKLIYDSHELYTERNKLVPSSAFWRFCLNVIEKFLTRQSDAVLTVNHSIAREMAKRYNVPSPEVVMNTPSSLKKRKAIFDGNGRLRVDLSIPPERKIILYVGAITFNRGLEELVSSLSFLNDCHLVYMGYGNETFKKKLTEIAESNHSANRFSFYGPVPSNRVTEFAADADIGVAPIINACLSYFYCLPNKIFEYMNAGLPVASSNFPELRSVVIGHDIGLTFDPSDPHDIARAINTILDDPQMRERMTTNAIEASSLYNWENESKKLLEIYNSL